MMKQLSFFFLSLTLALFLSACGEGGGNPPNDQDPKSESGSDSGPGSGKQGESEPGKGSTNGGGSVKGRSCGEVLKNCGLFNLSDEELARIRSQVLGYVPNELKDMPATELEITALRSLLLMDFVKQYYAHSQVSVGKNERKLYKQYFETINWN